ncbi:MAG: hypothetical protein ACJ77K_17635 [Bacteroidia bacterium]
MEEKEVFIAFLDILGFKDLVNNNTHSDLTRKINNLLIPTVESALTHGNSITVEREGKQVRIADIKEIKINSLSISDSVMFWTNDRSLESFIQITTTVRQILNNTFYMGLPMRGGISFGHLTFQNYSYGQNTDNHHTLLMGKGLVDTYMLESRQDWCGCVIEEKCINKIIEVSPKMATNANWFLSENVIIKYKTPYKSGKIIDEYVINWAGVATELNEASVRDSFAQHKKNCTDWTVEHKIQNTIKFVEYCAKFEIKPNI